jgi:hypothetical protein
VTLSLHLLEVGLRIRFSCDIVIRRVDLSRLRMRGHEMSMKYIVVVLVPCWDISPSIRRELLLAPQCACPLIGVVTELRSLDFNFAFYFLRKLITSSQ